MYGCSEFDGFEALMAASEATEVDPTPQAAVVVDAEPIPGSGGLTGEPVEPSDQTRQAGAAGDGPEWPDSTTLDQARLAVPPPLQNLRTQATPVIPRKPYWALARLQFLFRPCM